MYAVFESLGMRIGFNSLKLAFLSFPYRCEDPDRGRIPKTNTYGES